MKKEPDMGTFLLLLAAFALGALAGHFHEQVKAAAKWAAEQWRAWRAKP